MRHSKLIITKEKYKELGICKISHTLEIIYEYPPHTDNICDSCEEHIDDCRCDVLVYVEWKGEKYNLGNYMSSDKFNPFHGYYCSSYAVLELIWLSDDGESARVAYCVK